MSKLQESPWRPMSKNRLEKWFSLFRMHILEHEGTYLGTLSQAYTGKSVKHFRTDTLRECKLQMYAEMRVQAHVVSRPDYQDFMFRLLALEMETLMGIDEQERHRVATQTAPYA